MGQVPHYLLIGNGRVAKHFAHYFSLLNITFSTWQRQQSIAELQSKLKIATHALLLINDCAIDKFVEIHFANTPIIPIHCSGSLVSEKVIGVHPLMTFSQHLYDIEKYYSVPFIIDHDAPQFAELFPGLPNKYMRLDKSKKAKYHALCVLSTYSCMLWQKVMHDFENEFEFPLDIVEPMLKQQTLNILTDYKSALTGPLVRNDIDTINNNLQALESDHFQDIYAQFVFVYQQLQKVNLK